MRLEHQHFIFQGNVNIKNIDQGSKDLLKKFLLNLVKEINMEVLIDPQVAYSKFNAWTGMIGIVTSHVTFHYWEEEGYLQLDIYSCKKFEPETIVSFLKKFWNSSNEKILSINREPNREFQIEKIIS